MESKVSEKDMREVYFQAFGKEYDSADRKQAPLPLDIAYLVALNKLKREGKYEGGGEITDDTYYQSVNDFVFFCMNYPANFLFAFGSLKNHLANKFKTYYNSYGSFGVMIKFYTELDSKNRRILTDFAYENYDGTYINSDISEVEYFNSVNHFIFFCFNFPNNFMEAFPSNLRVHLSEKWSDAYNKKGSVGAMIYFWSELSDDNRKRLANWSKNNYKGTKLYEAGGLLGEVAGMLPSPLPMSTIQPMEKGGMLENAQTSFSIHNDYYGNLELGFYNIEFKNEKGTSISNKSFYKLDDAFETLFEYLKSENGQYIIKKEPKSNFYIEERSYDGKSTDSDGYPDTKYKTIFKISSKKINELTKSNNFEKGGQLELFADGGGVEPSIYFYNDGEQDITFTTFEQAYNEVKRLGYSKFRDNLGGEYFINRDIQNKYADGGGFESKNDCIEYIKNSESIKDNGYYLHIDNMYNYVGSNSLNIPKINSLCLITFNSGGQKNLKAVDTVNSILLSSEIAKLLNIDIEIARIIVSEQITFSKPFTMNILDDIENKNIIIADRDKIVCTNLSIQSNDSEYKSAFNSKQEFLKGKTELERIEDLKKEVSKNKWSREALTEESGIVKVYSRMYDLDKETVASIFNEYQKKYADGGGVDDFSKDEILIINQVLRNYLSDAESKLNYYSNGGSRYFHEEVRGNLSAYIESAKQKVSEINDDIKYFNEHKELPYGYLDTEHESKLFLTNLNELPKTNNGREIFKNEIYGDKYYEVYEKLYDRLDSYIDDKFDIKYSDGGDMDDISLAKSNAIHKIDFEYYAKEYAGDSWDKMSDSEKAELMNDIRENWFNDSEYAKGGIVVTKIKDIPNFKERLDEGRITYRGLGMGKLFDDFYKISGTTGTRIKVDGKEYFITDEEFDTFSRDENGKLKVRFDAPKRKFSDGGETIDLFEDYENIPANVQEVLDKYSERYGDDFSEMDYNDMAEMHKEIEKIGYTFDYGLDNMPYGLRPIGVELNQLRGYEKYGLGGFLFGAGVGALGYKLYLESKTKKGREKFKRTYNKIKKKVGL